MVFNLVIDNGVGYIERLQENGELISTGDFTYNDLDELMKLIRNEIEFGGDNE